MHAVDTDAVQADYTSSNLQKHTNPNPLQQWLLQRFHHTAATLIAQVQPRTVLDAGCGEGFAMQAVLQQSKATIIGLDGSHGAVCIASQINPQHRFTTGDLFDLPFADRHFDLVVCMEVLEHLDDPTRGLSELCRVSGDALLLSVPNEPLFRGANFLRGKNIAAWGNDAGHVNHWSARSFRRFVAGHCRIEAWHTSFPWTLVLCRVN